MDDLISRQKAIEVCHNYEDGEDAYADGYVVEYRLQCIPSAQQWIPCSERLPEDEQLVIFSTKTGCVHQGKYHKDNSANQWYSTIDKMRAWNNVVNAWMPLPEPYSERRQKGGEMK